MNIDQSYAVLQAMQGFTAQNSMTISALKQKTGIEIKDLMLETAALYARGMINRANITRVGLTELHVWPTGVLKPVNLATDYKISPPIRRAQTPNKTEPEAQYTNLNPKPKALVVLEYIEANPNSTIPQMVKATQIDFPRAYIKTAIMSGKVTVNKDNPRLCQYNLAAGWTASTIYRKRGPSVAQTEEPSPPPQPSCAAPKFRIARDVMDAINHHLDTKNNNPATANIDAATHIAALLKILPERFEINLSNLNDCGIQIHGEMLSDSISVKLHQVNETLDALNKLVALTANAHE